MSQIVEGAAKVLARADGNPEAWPQYTDEARAVIESIAAYYEGGLDAVGYGNLHVSDEAVATAKTVAAEMRRILAL